MIKRKEHTMGCVFSSSGMICMEAWGKEGFFYAGKTVFVRWGTEKKSEEEITAKDITSAVSLLKEKGFSVRHLSLALCFPTVHMKRKKLPDMCRSDMENTMHWEEDRLFPNISNPLSFSHSVLGHNEEGYDILSAACSSDLISAWADGARVAGGRFIRIVPLFSVADVLFKKDQGIVLLGRKERGNVYIYNHGKLIKSIMIRREDKESTGISLQNKYKDMNIDKKINCDRIVIPVFDCTFDNADYWEGYFPFSKTGWQMPISKIVHWAGDFPENAWLAALAAAAGKTDLNFALEEDRPARLFDEKKKTLRMLQSTAIVGCICSLWAGSMILSVRSDMNKETEKAKSLVYSKSVMEEYQGKRAESFEKKRQFDLLRKQDVQWQKKLIYMADYLPAGTVIDSICEEDGGIRIKGTADGNETVRTFQKRLTSFWGGQVRLESSGRDPKLPLYRFSVFWKREKNK